MNRKEVVKAIHECKKNANLDYALASAPGDCGSCSMAEIENKYGAKAKGIWLKYYTFGMNRRVWNEKESYCIAHDITKEQAEKIVETLSKYFQVDWNGENSQCIEIKDKR